MALAATLAPVSGAAQPPSPARPPLFRSGLDLIVVNAVVRDRNGELVRNLTRDDFTVLEDNKPQTISTFDIEELDRQSSADQSPAPAQLLSQGLSVSPDRAPVRPLIDLEGHRLILLFFDVSSMQPEEVGRAVRSAREYIDTRSSRADALAVAALGTSLRIVQDFTADRSALDAALDSLDATSGAGFEYGGTTDPDEAPDNGNAFLPDDTEFNIFNTDRRIEALRALADVMAPIQQKKSVIYFSGGMSQTGLDNRAALGALVDRAVRANVSIYAVDTRGLEALVPGGNAQSASVRGEAAFSGLSMDAARDDLAATGDTLVEMAENTGGRAFLDSNQLGAVFAQVVHDTTAYYLIGYGSTNASRDGKYRRIRITVKRPDLKVEYRAGYYAPRDFAHSNRGDRNQQLQDQLLSDLPPTDLPVHGQAGYFRLADNRYHVPLWVIVPGSLVPFTRVNNTARATLDVVGVLRDRQNRPIAWIRDTVRLSIAANEEVQRRNIQYNTSFELPPGSYRLRVVLRENQNGATGSLETMLVVPDLSQSDLKVSSVVLGSLRPTTAKPRKGTNPLATGGRELSPNIVHIVPSTQALNVFFEVYEPARLTASAGQVGSSRAGVRVLASLACFRGTRQVYQTDMMSSHELTAPERNAVAVDLLVPAGALTPGLYTCQVNVVDDIAGTFAFPRTPLYVAR